MEGQCAAPQPFGVNVHSHDTTSLDKFTCFASLPPEIRQMIWEVSVRSVPDVEELLIQQPSNFHPSNGGSGSGAAAPTVYTGFPAAMHVNHEARSVARKCIELVDAPRKGWSQCKVPVRAFRPDLDVLYVPWEGWRSFFLLKELYYGDAWVASLRHLAVDLCLSTNMAVFVRQLPSLPALQTLRFVLPVAAGGPLNVNSMLVVPGRATRCALAPCAPADRADARAPDDDAGAFLELLGVISGETYRVARAEMYSEPTEENRAALERHMNPWWKTMNTEMRANVLMEFRPLPSGRHGFVERGLDNVADLFLPIS